jgi:peptidoglycan/LPS O-acetylase OafA/YrhL
MVLFSVNPPQPSNAALALMEHFSPTRPQAASGTDQEKFLGAKHRLSVDGGSSHMDENVPIKVALQNHVTRFLHQDARRVFFTVPWSMRKLLSARTLLRILPSFLTDLLDKTPRPKKGLIKSNISALDGLRGLSCLMVMHMHWSYAVTDSYRNGSGETNTKYLFHRPFFQLLWAGHSHVNIFFVMSGYVLSVKCLNMVHRRASIYTVVASAVIRRGIRIFVPPLVLLLVFVVALQTHVFDKSNEIWKVNRELHQYQLALFETPPPVLATFSEQFWDAIGAAQALIDPSSHLNLPNYGNYDTHLWTMPVEFYCSMALFVVILGTSRLGTGYRLFLHLGLVLFCCLNGHQHHSLFFAGMTIAECDILLKIRKDKKRPILSCFDSSEQTAATTMPPLPTSPFRILFSYITPLNMISVLAFISGLYLLSLPLLFGEHTPGFKVLIELLPADMDLGMKCETLRSLGAVLVVWPITNTSITANPTSPPRLIQLFFANPVSAYLGKISFSFYLVHGFVIRSLGYTILPSIYILVVSNPERRNKLADTWNPGMNQWLEANEHLTAREVGTIWILGYLIVLPACIWMADVFWRAVDMRSVSLGRWLEQKMIEKDEGVVDSPRRP